MRTLLLLNFLVEFSCCTGIFLSSWQKVQPLLKINPQSRDWFHQIGLRVCLWGILLTDGDGEDPIPLWQVSPLGIFPWVMSEWKVSKLWKSRVKGRLFLCLSFCLQVPSLISFIGLWPSSWNKTFSPRPLLVSASSQQQKLTQEWCQN